MSEVVSADRPGSGRKCAAAGDLRCEILDGALGPVRWRGVEVIRRIFVTVRDANWSEIPPSSWTVDETEEGLRVTARHTSDDVDLSWSGRLALAAGDASA